MPAVRRVIRPQWSPRVIIITTSNCTAKIIAIKATFSLAKIAPVSHGQQYGDNHLSFYNSPSTMVRDSFDLQPLASRSLPVFNGRNQQEPMRSIRPFVSTNNAFQTTEYSRQIKIFD